MCLFGKQWKGCGEGERNAGEADEEKAVRGREEEAVKEVGHCIGFKAQEEAAGESHMEEHRYEACDGECCSCCNVNEVYLAG